MDAEDMFSLRGKAAFVTGGAVGIGRAYAHALALAGADVAIVDINFETARRTADFIRGLGVRSLAIQCDVSSETSVERMVAEVVTAFGRIDIAVNNAGIAKIRPDIDQTKRNWDAVIGVNLTGVWLCARAAARQMIKQQPMGGKIINTASMAGKIVADADGAYNAAKAGVVHLTHTLAAQWGAYNINVNSISPSYTMTPMEYEEMVPEKRAHLRGLIPMGSVQRPRDLFGPLVFLASTASDYVTGHDLMVDGGHTLNVWLEPLKRETPPRVSADEEMLEAEFDTQALRSS